MSTGPMTPTPPPGPSRLAAFLDHLRGDRARKAEAAATAGSYGRSAEPMSAVDRVRKYRAQTGRPALTPRQSRRAMHKLNRAVTAGVSSPQWPKPEQPKPTAPKPAVAA